MSVIQGGRIPLLTLVGQQPGLWNACIPSQNGDKLHQKQEPVPTVLEHLAPTMELSSMPPALAPAQGWGPLA